MTDNFGEEHIIERDGCLLHYWLAGPKDAPLIVLSHTGFVDHTMFDTQMALLTPNYCVLTWDMRGHGLSQPLRGTLSYQSAAKDIVALLDHLAVEKAILLGISMGGCAAQEVAFSDPQRVSTLILTGCPCTTMPGAKSFTIFSRIFLAIAHLLPEKTLKRQMTNSMNMPVPSTNLAVQIYIKEKAALISKPTFVAMFRSVLSGFHNEPDYRITQPLLLMHGDQDSPPIQAQAPLWAKREPNCRYEVIPNAGHNANQDNPEIFNRHLMNFLNE